MSTRDFIAIEIAAVEGRNRTVLSMLIEQAAAEAPFQQQSTFLGHDIIPKILPQETVCNQTPIWRMCRKHLDPRFRSILLQFTISRTSPVLTPVRSRGRAWLLLINFVFTGPWILTNVLFILQDWSRIICSDSYVKVF